MIFRFNINCVSYASPKETIDEFAINSRKWDLQSPGPKWKKKTRFTRE